MFVRCSESERTATSAKSMMEQYPYALRNNLDQIFA